MKSFCKVVWLVALMLGLCGHLPAQNREIVRLHTVIRDPGKAGQPDSMYVDTLDRLARAYYGNNADSAFFYARLALDYAGKTAYRQGEAESWRMLGNTYEMVGDYLNMLTAYQRSLDIAKEIGNSTQIAKANVNIALFYKQEGEYDQAQRLMEQVGESYKRTGDSAQAAFVASSLADLALRQHKYDLALQYAGRALDMASRLKDPPAMAMYNNDIGNILMAKGDYNGALKAYLNALDYYQAIEERVGVTATKSLLAQAYLQLKNYPQALIYAQQSMTEARAMHRKLEIQGSARVLAAIYEAKGDYRNALQYFHLYKDYSDSLDNDLSRKQILTRAAQYDYQQQASRLREEEAVKDAGYERALNKDALKIAVTVSLLAVLTLVAFILQRGRAANRRTNRLLREKNEKIEEQKEVLEQQAVQLLLSNQQKDKLFSLVAHDLRGPLNYLKGLLDFLKERKLSDQEIGTMLIELRHHVDSSTEMVSNLLYWAGSQLNGAVISPVILPVDELVDETLGSFVNAAKEKEVMLSNEIPPYLVGYADKDMMQVVVRNLLSNAIKFCRSGGMVTISGVKKAAEIEISVTDTGIGMKEDALDRIRRKESFSSYGTAREKGTGLGILLCHEFAEANKGRFYVESEWGVGSRCYFTIPAAPSSSSISV